MLKVRAYCVRSRQLVNSIPFLPLCSPYVQQIVQKKLILPPCIRNKSKVERLHTKLILETDVTKILKIEKETEEEYERLETERDIV